MRYLKGGELTIDEAVRARCYDCMTYYADGAGDCRMPECSLYPYMPFRSVALLKKASAVKADNKKSGKEKKKVASKKSARAGVKRKQIAETLRLF